MDIAFLAPPHGAGLHKPNRALSKCTNGRRPKRTARHRVTAPRASTGSELLGPVKELEVLRTIPVTQVDDNQSVLLADGWGPTEKCFVLFLTHFADFTSWELGRSLKAKVALLTSLGIKPLVVGLGSVANAHAFCALLDLPTAHLFADPTGAVYSALGFYKGLAPKSNVNPYVRLLAMLAGVGSDGTIGEVLRGYTGDRAAPEVFGGQSVFDVLGKGYQRPFELATLRLANMRDIVGNWAALAPEDPELLLWQGGSVAFDGAQLRFKQSDRGILMYTNIDDVIKALQ